MTAASSLPLCQPVTPAAPRPVQDGLLSGRLLGGCTRRGCVCMGLTRTANGCWPAPAPHACGPLLVCRHRRTGGAPSAVHGAAHVLPA
jgi:hypothetical protein